VFRTDETAGSKARSSSIRDVMSGSHDIKVSDRSLIWNSDLIGDA